MPSNASRPAGAETARVAVTRAPCELLRAIDQSLKVEGTDPVMRAGWKISFHSEDCCAARSAVTVGTVVMGFGEGEPDLLAWTSECPGGGGGPHVTKGEVHFKYVELYEKDARTLSFNVTPALRVFDGKGAKVTEEVQGCYEVSGTAEPATTTTR